MVTLDEIREIAKSEALRQNTTVYVIFNRITLAYDFRTVVTGSVRCIGEYDRDGYWSKY